MRLSFRIAILIVLTCVLSGAQEPAKAPPDESANPSATPKLDLTPDSGGKLSQAQMQELLRVVGEKDIENEKQQRNYTYIEREVQHNLDGNGNAKSTEERTFEILQIYGEEVQRLIEKDDKPL